MVGTPLTSYSPAQLSNLATLHHSLSLEDTVDFQTTWLGWYRFWFYLEYPVFLLLLIKSLTHFLDSMSNFTYSMKYFSYLPSCVFYSVLYSTIFFQKIYIHSIMFQLIQLTAQRLCSPLLTVSSMRGDV